MKKSWHPTKHLTTCLFDHLTYSLIAISFVRRQSLSNKYIKGPAIFSLSVLSSLYGRLLAVQWHRLKIHHSLSKVEFQWNAFFYFWPELRIIFCVMPSFILVWNCDKSLSWQVLFQQQNDWQQNWSVWHSVLQQMYKTHTKPFLSCPIILRNAFIIIWNMRK